MWLRWTEGRLPRLWLPVLAAGLAACAAPATRPGPGSDATAAAPDAAGQARHAVALAALEAGDDAQAEPQLQALVAQYPEHAGPMVNLALLQARRGELPAAQAMLERAVAVCSSCAVPWNALGVIQRQQGSFAAAEQSYRNALVADPGYANAAFNLGVLYEIYLQRPELALAQYARFRELVADDPAGADIDKWIAELERRARPVERAARLAEGKP